MLLSSQNPSKVELLLLAFTWAFSATYLLVPIVSKLAWRIGAIDKPSARRVHAKVTPRCGGIALFIALHSSYLLLISLSPHIDSIITPRWWLNFFLASTIVLLVGLMDDVREARPVVKMCGQTLAALVLYSMDLRVDSLWGVEFAPATSCILTVLWFLFIINAFNLIDGIDGLASGLAAIGALGIAGLFVHRGMYFETMLVAAFIGCCIGFLRYNRHPASIFLGDCGSNLIGLFLGALMLATESKGSVLVNFWVPCFMISVPALDILLAISRRGTRKILKFLNRESGKSGIMSADTEHLHHRLLKLGFNQRNVAAFLYLLNAALVLTGLLVLNHQRFAPSILFIPLLCCFVLLYSVVPSRGWQDFMALVYCAIVRPRRPRMALAIGMIIDLSLLGLSLAIATAAAYPFSTRLALEKTWCTYALPWIGTSMITMIILETSIFFGLSAIQQKVLRFAALQIAGVLIALYALHNFGNTPSANLISHTLFFSLLTPLFLTAWRRSLNVIERYIEARPEVLVRYLVKNPNTTGTQIIEGTHIVPHLSFLARVTHPNINQYTLENQDNTEHSLPH